LPADSVFAVAMRHQQEAEKEEKKRLKNLVLNLDLRDDTDADGTASFSHLLRPNPNLKAGRPRYSGRTDSLRDSLLDSTLSEVNFPVHRSAIAMKSSTDFSVEQKTHYPIQGGSIDRNLPNPYFQPRTDRPAKKSTPQRGRQLQVSDLDWYGSSNSKASDLHSNAVSHDETAVFRENKGRRGGHGQSHARGRRR
jgi:regulator of nonsense transcripts 2